MLYIVSQDGLKIEPIGSVFCDNKYKSCYVITINGTEMGKYKSKEMCLKVMKSLMKEINGSNSFVSDREYVSDLVFKEKHTSIISCDTTFQLPQDLVEESEEE